MATRRGQFSSIDKIPDVNDRSPSRSHARTRDSSRPARLPTVKRPVKGERSPSPKQRPRPDSSSRTKEKREIQMTQRPNSVLLPKVHAGRGRPKLYVAATHDDSQSTLDPLMQRARRKLLRTGARQLLRRERRTSISERAKEKLASWQDRKLKIRKNLASLRDEMVGKNAQYDNICDFGLEQLKDDSNIHHNVLKGQTERLLARKRLKHRHMMRDSEKNLVLWKRRRKWLAIIAVVAVLKCLIKYARCSWTKKYHVLTKVATTSITIKRWVRSFQKKIASNKVRAFLRAAVLLDSEPARIYRFRVSILILRRAATKVQGIWRAFRQCHYARVLGLVELLLKLENEEHRRKMRQNRNDLEQNWKRTTEKASILLAQEYEEDRLARRQQLIPIMYAYVHEKRRDFVLRNFPKWKDQMTTWAAKKEEFDTDDIKWLLKDPSAKNVKKRTTMKKQQGQMPLFPRFNPERELREDLQQKVALS